MFVVWAVSASSYAANFEHQWHHAFYGITKSGNTPICVIKTTDGKCVSMTAFGSNTLTGVKVLFDNDTLKDARGQDIIGCPYQAKNSNSSNANLLLQKLDPATGDVIWTVYSDKGSLRLNASAQPTKDGGVIIVSDVVNLADRKEKALFRLVGADGVKTEVEHVPDARGRTVTEGVVAKIDKDGKVLWARLIATTTHPSPKRFGGHSAFYNSLVLDSEDNIYICGNYLSAMTFTKRNGSVETHQAKNTKAWDGTAQSWAGDPFIAKLDKDGYLLQFLTEDESSILHATFDQMVIRDNTLYVAGCFHGDTIGTSTIRFGDKSLKFNYNYNLVYASVKTDDLSINYFKAFETRSKDKKVHTATCLNLQYYNDHLYITRKFTGDMADDAVSEPFIEAQTERAEAMIIQVNPRTGERLAAGADGGSVTFSCGVLETKDPATIWTYGYNLNAGTRCCKYTLSGKRWVRSIEEVIFSNTAVGEIGRPLIDGQSIVSIARASNNSGQLLGSADTYSFYHWGLILCKYTNEDILPDGNLHTDINGITIQPGSHTRYNVYSLSGVLVRKADTIEDAKQDLAPGIYIIGGKKYIVR